MLATAALVLVGGGCRQAPTVDDLAVVADALEPPQGWHQVDEERVGRCADPVESCPRIVKVYDVPAEVDFAASAERMLERGSMTVTESARNVCGTSPERGCGLQVANDDVVALVVVTETAADRYTVSARFTEYVGP